jgi:hypothetical protein
MSFFLGGLRFREQVSALQKLCRLHADQIRSTIALSHR